MAYIDTAVADALAFLTDAFVAVAACNAIELLFWIFNFFKRWQGLYFWSILIATLLIITVVILDIVAKFKGYTYDYYIGILIFWPFLIVFLPLVLYSRLHLISRGPIVKFMFCFILATAAGIYIPLMTLYSGWLSLDSRFNVPLELGQKYLIMGEMVREYIICGVYIFEAIRQLKPIMAVKGHAGRTVLVHLIFVNITVILFNTVPMFMPLVLYGQIDDRGANVMTNYYCFSQSFNLKMEFSVLNRLVALLQTPPELPSLAGLDTVGGRAGAGPGPGMAPPNASTGSTVPLTRATVDSIEQDQDPEQGRPEMAKAPTSTGNEVALPRRVHRFSV